MADVLAALALALALLSWHPAPQVSQPGEPGTASKVLRSPAPADVPPSAGAICPPGVDPAACAEQSACVSRVYRARTASTGATATEAALVARLDAEHACALAAWSRVRSSSIALSIVRAAPPLVPPPLACPEAPACSTLAATLISAGSCALCGGAAAAVCGVAR